MGLDEAVGKARLDAACFGFKGSSFRIHLHGFYLVILSFLKEVVLMKNRSRKMRKLAIIDFVQIEVSDHPVLGEHFIPLEVFV